MMNMAGQPLLPHKIVRTAHPDISYISRGFFIESVIKKHVYGFRNSVRTNPEMFSLSYVDRSLRTGEKICATKLSMELFLD